MRRRLHVAGLVQGVGFRPFVYVLARDLGLSGSVRNGSDGVTIDVEGPPAAVETFDRRLTAEAPPLARIDRVRRTDVPPLGGTSFVIEDSHGGSGRTLVSPDVATCEDCLAEFSDPDDRRYRHPFISCTNCGPRFSVVVDLPYDRPATTMASLPLCAACAAEYADPTDRRFHAQTVACPDCGPTLTLEAPASAAVSGDAAVAAARRLLADGAILAVKGLGGYHLACDATNPEAVNTLRKRKDRGDKPFAVMVANTSFANRLVEVSAAAADLLAGPRRPIVLLPRRPRTGLAEAVAPGAPDLGVLLPYTPVHHLLFGLAGDPPGPTALVMTSGNSAGEPIATRDADARHRLATLADAWLVHDRRIVVPCDDSVIRLIEGRELPIRRSRGYAPLPLTLPHPVAPAIAVGGDLKNTFATAEGRLAWMSAHVGDLDDLGTLQAFDRATGQLGELTRVKPQIVVADRHPGYRSTAWARSRKNVSVVQVQHHHAHVAAAMAENGHPGTDPVIGIAFDGTGFGDDGAVWGGELLIADYGSFERAGNLAYVLLPGGDSGVRNPCRMALSHLRAAQVEWDDRLPSVAACSPTERNVLERQLDRALNCVPTSSMGRLFDAVSSIAGVCHRVAYEAEAAMRFEALARRAPTAEPAYSFQVAESLVADPAPVIRAVSADVLAGTPAPVIAARFHRAVSSLVVTWAVAIRDRTGLSTVAISGGVFLNTVLTGECTAALTDRGFDVLRHRRVPPSDAGLALGQLAIGARIEPDHV
jgi:hydrogenase maturation protein HypF